MLVKPDCTLSVARWTACTQTEMQMQEAFSKFAVEDVVKRKILRRLRSPRLPLLMGLGPQAVITCHCQPMVSCIRIIPIVLKPFFIERQNRNIVDIVSKKKNIVDISGFCCKTHN